MPIEPMHRQVPVAPSRKSLICKTMEGWRWIEADSNRHVDGVEALLVPPAFAEIHFKLTG